MAKITQIFLLISCCLLFSCKKETNLILGADNIKSYLPLIKGKKIAVIGNQTSMIANTHLVDSLLSLDVEIVKFSLLKKIYKNDKSKKTIEHVTSSIILSKNINKYNFLLSKNFSDYNLSVDCPEDLELVKKIYKIYGPLNFSVKILLNILKKNT